MEIEQTLNRYGAQEFGYMNRADITMIGFKVGPRDIRISISKPDPSTFKVKRSGYWVTPTEQQRAAWVQTETRRRWRALLLVIKAKLEAVESKIATFEDEFLPYTVMPNGETVAERLSPVLKKLYETGQIPEFLALPAGAA